MFTGLVEAATPLRATEALGGGLRIVVPAPDPAWAVGLGESVAVSGCCLTVVEGRDPSTGEAVAADTQGADMVFDLSAETIACTHFGRLEVGDLVNHPDMIVGRVPGKEWRHPGKEWHLPGKEWRHPGKEWRHRGKGDTSQVRSGTGKCRFLLLQTTRSASRPGAEPDFTSFYNAPSWLRCVWPPVSCSCSRHPQRKRI